MHFHVVTKQSLHILDSVVHSSDRDQIVTYKRVKTMENYKPSSKQGISVAYNGWSFTRGSNINCSINLTGKILALR